MEPHLVRIIPTPLPDGRVSLSMYDVRGRRHVSLGIKAGPLRDDIDREVRRMKDQLEAKGFRVEVR